MGYICLFTCTVQYNHQKIEPFSVFTCFAVVGDAMLECLCCYVLHQSRVVVRQYEYYRLTNRFLDSLDIRSFSCLLLGELLLGFLSSILHLVTAVTD